MNTKDFIKKYDAEYISSRSNARITDISKLCDKKYREVQRRFLAEGVKLTSEALTHSSVDCILISESAVNKLDRIFEIADAARSAGSEMLLLSDSVFEKVSTERAPQGVIAVVNYMDHLHSSGDFLLWQQGKRLLMLDGIRDPGNLGTILRSAEALGIEGVVLYDCADIYNTKTVRAAMGSVFRLPTFSTDSGRQCVELMNSIGRRTIGAALGDHSLVLGQFDVLSSDCPIIGNEGHGISDEVLSECSDLVVIPMCGETESLNAAQATACILWEYNRNNI